MILRITKWRLRGGGSIVARGLVEIARNNTQLLYLETDPAILADAPSTAYECSAMRQDFSHTLRLVGRMLQRQDSVLIHSHGRIAGYHARLCRLRYGRRVKIVHSFHGVASYRHLKRGFTLATESLLTLLTDAVVADSPSELAAFGRLPFFSKAVAIPPFYNEENVTDHVFRPVRRIGFASRFDFPKLHEDLIRLIAAYNRRGKEQLTLVFCGDGPKREAADRLGLELLGSRYESLGHLPNIANFHRSIDAFAHFSLFEGMPVGLIEAMACGLPCMATNVPGCRDLISHDQTGLLMEVGSTEEGLRALDRLLHDPTVAQLAAAGREAVRAKNAKSIFLANHAALYRQVGYTIPEYEKRT